MKKILSLLLLLAGSLTAMADTWEDGLFKFTDNEMPDCTCRLVECKNIFNDTAPNEIRIPGKVLYNGTQYTVTGIGQYVFHGYNRLETLHIPSTVTKVEHFAFNNCINLKDLYIDDFSAWFRINFDGVEANPMSYAQNVYVKGELVKDMAVPSDISVLTDYCIASAAGIKTLTIPSTVKKVGWFTFYNCASTVIRMESATPPATDYGLQFNNSCTIIIPRQAYEAYKEAWPGASRNFIFDDMPTEYVVETMADETHSALRDQLVEQTGLESGMYNVERLTIKGTLNSYDVELIRSVMPNLKHVDLSEASFVYANYQYTFWSQDQYETKRYRTSMNVLADAIFANKTHLETVVLPEGLLSIGQYAFYGCKALESVNLPTTLNRVSWCAFQGCSALKEADMSACQGTDFTIYNRAFNGCASLTDVKLAPGTKAIYANAFRGCSSLEEIVIPETVTAIEEYAFTSCNLQKLTLPSTTAKIDINAFYRSGIAGIDMPGGKLTCTPTTLTLIPRINASGLGDASYRFTYGSGWSARNFHFETFGSPVELNRFEAGRSETVFLVANVGGKDLQLESIYYTPLNITVSGKSSVTASTIDIELQIKKTVASYKLSENSTTTYYVPFPADIIKECHWSEYPNISGNLHVTGLDPDRYYSYKYIVKTDEGEYVGSFSPRTASISFATQPAQAMNTKTALLTAETNVGADEENVGFEWRRYDAPDEMPSQKVTSAIDDGKLMGALSGLNPDVYYKYRPYYTSASGNSYYGEWVAFLTGDANVYFDPTVRTYTPQVIGETVVSLKGFALRGSEEITKQGFQYWKATQETRAAAEVTEVEVKGQKLVATISGLEPGTDYCYRAFAVTASGIIYGDEQTFKTLGVPTAIAPVAESGKQILGIFNLQGRRLQNFERGINIIRYSDGTSSKVMKK